MIPDNEWLANGLIKHTLRRPDGLLECQSVLDIGAGIRPMSWYVPENHTCVEPHPTYVKRLKQAGFNVWLNDALDCLKIMPVHEDAMFEAIYLLDVIEHMEKDEGVEVVSLAVEKAKKQVVIFTPLGFMQQDDDGWGLDGEYWQKHRSGWLPEEFSDWKIQHYGKGFFALFTK